jgi:SAM-dependent methyltransferase
MKKILLVAHDAGGSEVLSAWFRKNRDNSDIYCCLEGPAVTIFQRDHQKIKTASLEFIETLSGNDMVITGTSLESSLERDAVRASKKAGIFSVSFLDHWDLYESRFEQNEQGEFTLPDEIWVGDKYALRLAEKIGLKTDIVLKDNPYFSYIKEQSENFTGKVKYNILYIGEPVSIKFKETFGETADLYDDELTIMSKFLKDLKEHQFKGVLKVRLHPRESISKYDFLFKEFSDSFQIDIADQNETLLKNIQEAEVVVGIESMGLVIANISGKKVFSYRTGRKWEISLPFPEIISTDSVEPIINIACRSFHAISEKEFQTGKNMEKKQTVKALHEQRAVLWDQSISAHKKYIDPSTQLFNTKYTEERKCPVCNSDSLLYMFNKEGGVYVKCRDCSMVFLNPVLKDEFLYEFYTSNHTVQAEVVESDLQFYIKLYNLGLDTIANIVPDENNLSILDIGCSSGIFLDVATKRNWETYGIELNRKEAELAKKKNHIIYSEIIEKLDINLKFNVITMWDVFEHIKNGETFLKEVIKHLAPGGVIFMQIPSSASLAASIMHENCNMFDGMEHVNLYSYNSLKVLLERCNLEISSIKTVISETGVLNNYLQYENPYTGNIPDTGSILNLIDEQTIHENLLGYKYQVAITGKKN